MWHKRARSRTEEAMTPNRLFPNRAPLCAAVAIVLSSTLAFAQGGWIKAGSHPADYDMGNDPTTAFTGTSSGYIKSSKPEPQGFGTYMQMIDATDYRGKRVRLSAQVKAQSVADWAGVWMRVDAPSGASAFDNMQDRPIKGAQDWTNHTIVLDVGTNATAIAFGVLLSGKGSVWIDDIELEAVGQDVPVTDVLKKRTGQPRNLDFESAKQ
jgi:hypothetical protein